MKKSKKIVLLILAMGSIIPTGKAQNLVSNPGFESYSACPTSFAQYYQAIGWTNPTGHTGSADYLNSCGSMGTTNPLNNYFGGEATHSGNGMMGFAGYYQSVFDFREYIQTQLTSTLTAGQTYSVQFYISLGDFSVYSTDGIQVHFRNTPAAGSGNWNPLPYVPQISQPAGTCIGSRIGWTLFSGSFVAAGGEQYMIIGNFDNDAGTSTCYIGPTSYTTGYYYFDDFSVTPGPVLAADLLEYTGYLLEGKAKLIWKAANEQQLVKYVIERSTDLIHFEKAGELSAKGAANSIAQYQFVDDRAPINELVYYRLVSINASGENGFAKTLSLMKDDQTEFSTILFPNPATSRQSSTLSWNSQENEVVSISITDLAGQIELDQMFDATTGFNEFIIPVSMLSSGIYFVNLRGKCTQWSQKLIVK